MRLYKHGGPGAHGVISVVAMRRKRRAPAHSGQVGIAHEIAVAFAGGTPALVEGPDDEALAAAAIAGRKNVGKVGRVFAVIGFDVGAWVAIDF